MAGMADRIDYTTPGPLTDLVGVRALAFDGIASDADGIRRPVHSLIIEPRDAKDLGVPAERFSENNVRPVGRLIHAIMALDPEPLHVPREPRQRVIGTCRHFAVMSCALLRYRGI